ncbi:MAG: hypothetical protein PHI03_04390 [Bacteroidales bacterium]|nr:hypothetical protein [Bacteroidales bacterium]
MKKQTLLTLMVAIATSVTINAQTIALQSSTGSQLFKGQTALADAYTAASNADTLYLSGHTFAPPSAFDKQLTVIGAGHYVDSTLATGKTFISGSVILSENADGFYLEGVEITGGLYFTSNASVNNVVIKRCKVNSTVTISGDLSNPTTNLSLVGNVFIGRIDIDNATNVLLSNNIIANRLFNSNSNQISNNIFLYSSYSSYCIYGGNNNYINNNVFLTGYINDGNGNTFRNNVIVSSTPGYGATPTASGNYIGIAQADIFVNQTGTAFNYAHDYHLQNPETYLGIDGTQVGIYGGTFPYKEGAVPLNPHIQLKNIAPTTDANGNLQIEFQVEAQED